MSSKHVLKNKEKYLLLAELFINKEIDGEMLQSKFIRQRSSDLDTDLLDAREVRDKELSGEISWDEYRSSLEKDYGYPDLNHPLPTLVDAIYSELKRFCPPEFMDAFEPEREIDECTLRINVRNLLEEYKKNEKT